MSVVATTASAPTRLLEGARPRRGRSWLLALGDLTGLTVAYLAMRLLTESLGLDTTDAPAWLGAGLALAAVPFAVALFAAYGLYDNDLRRVVVTSVDETGAIFHALLVGSLGLLMVDQGLRLMSDWRVSSALQSAVFVVIAVGAVIFVRGALRSWVFTRVFRRRRALVVGSGPDAAFLERTLAAHPDLGLDVVAVVPESGLTEELPATIEALGIDRVVLTSSGLADESMLDLVRTIRRPDVQISIIPRYFEVFTAHATLEDLAGAPVVTLPPSRLRRSSWVIKRGFDVVVSAVTLAVLSPLLLALAAAVRLDSPGPVLYRQARRGRDGTTFLIAKFRTMAVGAEGARAGLLHLNAVDGPLFKIKGHDPRVTRLGAVLRRWSIDELPQLWNVLRGEMSLVGPRPFVVYEADRITGWGLRRLDMTPGITGPWQVLGRNDLSFEDMVRLDYLYATNWSLWWDLRILYRTILVVLRRKGAY
jgi:exopolysaccharide biosynthesis polyprenyl glycosylphosphotransferase